MKLVDLLIKHNVQWPAGSTSVWQGVSRNLYWSRMNRDAFVTTNLPELSARDGLSLRCTKEEYDAARLKWIRNRGTSTKCPVQRDRDIEVRFRSGHILPCRGASVALMRWSHLKNIADIMAWRYV